MGAEVDAVLVVARQVVVDDESACRPYSSVIDLLEGAERKLALGRLESVAARICTCRPHIMKRWGFGEQADVERRDLAVVQGSIGPCVGQVSVVVAAVLAVAAVAAMTRDTGSRVAAVVAVVDC